MSLLKINGAAIADPSELQWDISDIEGDSTGRSLGGEPVSRQGDGQAKARLQMGLI